MESPADHDHIVCFFASAIISSAFMVPFDTPLLFGSGSYSHRRWGSRGERQRVCEREGSCVGVGCSSGCPPPAMLGACGASAWPLPPNVARARDALRVAAPR